MDRKVNTKSGTKSYSRISANRFNLMLFIKYICNIFAIGHRLEWRYIKKYNYDYDYNYYYYCY